MKHFLPVVLACSSLLAALLFPPDTLRRSTANVQAQAEPAVPDSPAGLQSQLEEILRSKDQKELKQRERLIGALRIPDPGAWFAGAFGNDDGAKLAATYQSTWEKFEESVANRLTDLAEEERTEVSVKEFRFPAKPAAASLTESQARDVKPANVFYIATATKGSLPVSQLPGIYTYAQGAFRVVDWQTLYTLPYLRPKRIRTGGNVAAAKLLHQVTPEYPDEARKERLSGTVVLHVILNREGHVIEIVPVSGPPELVQASMDAVRQWTYQPTLLNGDPVEVDTTIAVQFTLN